MTHSLRNLLGVVLPAGWLVGAVIPFALAWHRLPEPMASHWSMSGRADGALPRIATLAICLGIALLATVGARTAMRPGRSRRPTGSTYASAAFMGFLAIGLSTLLVALNLDAPDWNAARSMSWLGLAAILGGSGALAAWVARAARGFERAVDIAPPSVGLGITEKAVWFSAAHNHWMTGAALVLGVAAAARLAAGSAWSAAVLAVVAILCGAFAHVRVRIDEQNVYITFGPWGFPSMRVPLARVRAARAIDVTPLAWGYRGSLTIAGRAAIIVRRGEAVELRLDGGKILSITVDDAATGAGLVNDLLARA